jgi:uncharacterized protein with HEPN domain
MPRVSDADIATDMIDLIGLIQRQIGSLDYTAFQKNRDKVDATAYRLQALGEYSTRLSEDFRNRHSTIAWQKMRGMRNILSHSYDYIDARLIWVVANTELTPIRAALADELQKS